ncbi:unnamed protein product, partial [Amoebophrya sp. A25]|eukprot:GSA25T00011719001.1
MLMMGIGLQPGYILFVKDVEVDVITIQMKAGPHAYFYSIFRQNRVRKFSFCGLSSLLRKYRESIVTKKTTSLSRVGSPENL